MWHDESMKGFKLFLKKFFRYILKPLSFIPAIVMMYFIFHFSAQTGNESSSLSYEVSKTAVLAYNRLCMKGYDNYTLNELIAVLHPYIRKAAHVTEYMLLAGSVSLPLYVYRIRGLGLTAVASIFCMCFAVLDEYHQSFVAGRSSSPRDVAIDCIGIFIGVTVVRILGFIGRKTVFSGLSLEQKHKT